MIASVRERFGHLIHEVAKFGVVGAVGFIVTVAGFNLLYYDAGLGSFTSDAIAVIVAAGITYVGNRFWTFRHRDGQGTTRDTVLFFALNGAGLIIQYVPIGVTDHLLHLTDRLSNNVALVIGVGFGTLFRFWSYRRWVWGTPAGIAGDSPPVPAVAVAAPGAYAEAGPVARQASPR